MTKKVFTVETPGVESNIVLGSNEWKKDLHNKTQEIKKSIKDLQKVMNEYNLTIKQ